MKNISNEFSYLDGAWHLAYYIPEFRPPGSISDYLLKFKNHDIVYVPCWIVWSIVELSNLGIQFDYIVRALGSDELLVSNDKGLDCLGQFLEKELHSHYVPNILKKEYITPSLHKLKLTRAQREEAIYNSYSVSDQTLDFNNKNILILDDVITSGTTIREIHRALKEVWLNGRYHLFCLVKTNHNINSNDNISMKYFT